MKTTLAFLATLLLLTSPLPADPLQIESDRFTATFELGRLALLKDRLGHELLGGGPGQGVAIERIGAIHPAGSATGAKDAREYARFDGLPDATARGAYQLDKSSGDLVIRQSCQSPQPGVRGVTWSIGPIPLSMNIIVPGFSGIKLTADSPGTTHIFDYAFTWEAQLVIVEGPGYGFYVWAEDDAGRHKRLTVRRGKDGWRLELTTINFAPFDELTECQSVPWHLNTYEGTWRVPARRYRDWAAEHLAPTPIARQKPAWVKDIRCCVIMDLDIATIEQLAARLDPGQTLLYVYDWRKAGYDRDYPVYDQPMDNLGPFLDRAHALGYRVMLHVNYFGCDPLNPLYKTFEPFQVRDPLGTHEKLWWLWTKTDPIIKFAYINPAHKPWRELFVARMKKLCETYAVDALHLDQTLCVWNDHNGPIDGQSMLQGNLALHRELRKALPQVALSGEGLNEVTYRYEAFAQRHVWGIYHADGTFDRTYIKTAHPICSYLFRPFTIIYGYLGMVPPSHDQLYAAWQEAYRRWGVIPTLKPDNTSTRPPTGFTRQFFDEVRFYQQHRVEIDIDGPWPGNVAFPLKTAQGERVVWTTDRRLLHADREISRTITGASELHEPGTIPNWRAYDREQLFGLDPTRFYPYINQPRDMGAFHIESLPNEFQVTGVVEQDELAMLRVGLRQRIVARFADQLDGAICGSRPFEAEAYEAIGPLHGSDGATFSIFSSADHVLAAHPPFQNPGTGVAFARFRVHLPAGGKLHFKSEVAMDDDAVGQPNSDGVTFGVRVVSAKRELQQEFHTATDQRKPLVLDLSFMAGQMVDVELSVHPGPNNSADFDWARWYDPRIERELTKETELIVVSPERFTLALSGTMHTDIEPQGDRYRLRAAFPGSLFLLKQRPDRVSLPLDLARTPSATSFLSRAGMQLDSPRFAYAGSGGGKVGGQLKVGLAVHPPDHGLTIVHWPIELPVEPAKFHTFVGLRDGSKSSGVVFSIEANGVLLAQLRVLPGQWHELTGDLTPWVDRPVVLSLITDSDGGFNYDWAVWGEPMIRAKGKP